MNILESDMQFTRDQVPMIMHDATVNRTTDGQGRVSSLTIRQIRRLDAGDGAKVPRLRGLVALAARRNVNLLAELKAPGATVPQVRKVLRIVRSRGMGSHTTFHSRHRANLRRVNRIAPGSRRCGSWTGRMGSGFHRVRWTSSASTIGWLRRAGYAAGTETASGSTPLR